MLPSPAIRIDDVSFRYGERQALRNVSLEVAPGEIFALLGPNGGGKSTLFRLLATLIPLQRGDVEILSLSVNNHAAEIRKQLGVVFRSPSVDPKLRVWENVRHQAWLYGLSGQQLVARGQELLSQLGLADRARDYVEALSGGLRRRLELAKGMLHHPAVLIMDEPSTGLDPAARFDFWTYLRQLRDQHGVTILLTTHLLEEAERADRVAILSAGEVVACGQPDKLRRELGGETIVITPVDAANNLANKITELLQIEASIVDEHVHLSTSEGPALASRLLNEFADEIAELRIGKPTLEDVFIARTGHRFWNSNDQHENTHEENIAQQSGRRKRRGGAKA